MAKAKISKGRYLRAINKSCRKELYKKLQCLRRFGMSMVQAILFQTTNSGHRVPPFLISTVSPAIATSSREYLPKELSKMHMQTLLGTRTGNGLWQGSSHWAQAQDTAAIWSTYFWMCRRLQYVSRKYEASSSSYFHSKLWIWIVGCLGSCWVRAMYFTDHAGKIVHSLKPSYRPKGLPQSGNTGKVGKVGKVFSAHHFKSVCIRVEVWSPNSKKPAILLIRASPDLPPPRETIMKGCHTKIRSLGVEGTVVSIRFQSISTFIATLKVEHKTHHLIEFFRWIENHHVSPLILAPWTKIRLLWQ